MDFKYNKAIFEFKRDNYRRCWMKVVFSVCFLSMAAAGIGVNFSPSYAAEFCFLFMVTIFIREALSFIPVKGKVKTGLATGTTLFSAVGSLALLIGSFTYAFGDDPLRRNMIVSAATAVLILILLASKCGRENRRNAADGLSLFFSMLAGVFSLLSGITCPALLPVGAGALSVTAAWLLRKEQRSSALYSFLLGGGFLLTAMFLVAPMVF